MSIRVFHIEALNHRILGLYQMLPSFLRPIPTKLSIPPIPALVDHKKPYFLFVIPITPHLSTYCVCRACMHVAMQVAIRMHVKRAWDEGCTIIHILYYLSKQIVE